MSPLMLARRYQRGWLLCVLNLIGTWMSVQSVTELQDWITN